VRKYGHVGVTLNPKQVVKMAVELEAGNDINMTLAGISDNPIYLVLLETAPGI
jgi:hypothetical protein